MKRRIMMRRIMAVAISIQAMTGVAWAQSAREVLDATAACMTKMGDVRAQFKATQFSGTTPQNEATGTMCISGRKFQMQTDELMTWYDGTTQWSMMNGSNEVNMATPDEEEQAAQNPATLVGIYKKGYRYSLTRSTLRGRSTYVVHLSAKNRKAAFSDIFIDVDQTTYHPLCIRAKKDGDWTRLSILSFQNSLTLPASTFTFPASDYPNVEVIDLR